MRISKLLIVSLLLSMTSLLSAKESWLTDYKKATEIATKNKQMIIVDFTGSDWCPWCIKLDNEIFSKKEFKNFVKDKFVLLKVDFPRRTKISKEQMIKNQELAKKYSVRGFPTVLVLDKDGKVVKQLGYMPGGPKNFIEALKKLIK